MDIDLQAYHGHIKIRKKDNKNYLFDPVRKKELIVQPEELVRQSWIYYLHHEHSISMASLSVEKKIKVGEFSRRYDLIAYYKGTPKVLFEFKSFNVNITDRACRQIASYNLTLSVQYLVISNGLAHFAYYLDHETSEIKSLSKLSFLSEYGTL